MFKRTLGAVLLLEAALALILAIVGLKPSAAFSEALAFPFEPLAFLLRKMSLSGAAGNVLAIVIYCAVCLLPLFYLVLRHRKGRARGEDFLLALSSLLLFISIYLMINPALLAQFFPLSGDEAMISAAKFALGSMNYCVLIGYAALHATRAIGESGAAALPKYLRYILAAACALYVWAIFFACVSESTEAVGAFLAQNTGAGSDARNLTIFFIILRQAVKAAGYALQVAIFFAALRLCSELERDVFSDETVCAASSLSLLCKRSIIIVIALQIALNILQLMAAGAILDISIAFNLPLDLLLLSALTLLFARYFAEGKAMRDENDMFI